MSYFSYEKANDFVVKIASNLETAQKHARKFHIETSGVANHAQETATNLTAVQQMNAGSKQVSQAKKEVILAAESIANNLKNLANTIEKRDQELSRQWK